MLNKLAVLVNDYTQKYKHLIVEYPFLKLLIKYSVYFFISLIVLYISNFSLFWRLGWIIDWLNFLSVIGIFSSFFILVVPYIMANEPSQPLESAVDKQKQVTKRKPWWHIHPFFGSLVLLFASSILMIVLLFTFESNSDAYLLVMSFLVFAFFIWGLVLLIKSLQLAKLARFLSDLMIKMLSRNTWVEFFRDPPKFTVRISFDNRNSVEKLKDTYAESDNKTTDPLLDLDNILHNLKSEDFVIVIIKDKPDAFVQYIKLSTHLRMEIVLPQNKTFSTKKKLVLNTLRQEKVYQVFWKFGFQLNPDIFYQIEDWKDEEGNKKGEFVVVNCRYKYSKAAKLGLAMLESVYSWNKTTPLTYEIGTYNDSLWRKLWD